MERGWYSVGSVLGVLLRLAIISIVVGIVLSALGITPRNIVHHMDVLARRIYNMGFGAIWSAFKYMMLGAIVVVPIWLIVRLVGIGGRGDDGPG